MNVPHGQKDGVKPHHDFYFQTDDLTERIGRESVRGGALALAAALTETVLRLGTLLVFARLLSPQEFGLFGMAMVPVALLSIFQQFGLPTAIVQYPTLRHEHVSRLFWVNLGWNVFLACAATASIPLFGVYFGERGLSPLSLAGIVGAFAAGNSVIHAGLLNRRMRFGILSAGRIISAGCGAAVGLVLAVVGAGTWALVLHHAAINLSVSIVRWVGCSWRPARPARSTSLHDRAVRDLLRFGRNTLIVRVLERLSTQLHTVIVGRISGVGVLGLYQNAQRWASLPVEQLGSLEHVAVSGMSRLADTPARCRKYTRALWLLVCSLAFPILGLIVLDARTMIELLLGPKWTDAAVFLRLLAAGVTAECLMRILTWILFAEGRTSGLARWGWGRALVLAIGMGSGVRWGPPGVAAGYAIAAWLYVIPTVVVLTNGTTRMTKRDFAGAVWRPLLASLTAGSLWLILSTPRDEILGINLPEKILPYSSFVVAYAAVWAILPGACGELRHLLSVARDQPPFDGSGGCKTLAGK